MKLQQVLLRGRASEGPSQVMKIYEVGVFFKVLIWTPKPLLTIPYTHHVSCFTLWAAATGFLSFVNVQNQQLKENTKKKKKCPHEVL